MTTTPAIAACEELIGLVEGPLDLRVGYVKDEVMLRELWDIDRQAYGDMSLDFQPFLEWWSAYSFGSTLLTLNGAIVASIGIYPLRHDQATAFIAGQISEATLRPASLEVCQTTGIANWYISGVVIRPDLQHRGILRRLIEIGVGTWLSSGHTAYPAKLFGLAQYDIGGRIMQKLGMEKWRDLSEMADHCDIYGVELTSEKHARSLLRLKGA